jgi:hypothetical protein
VMEPNTKIWIEELVKKIHGEIKEGFATHTNAFNKCFSKLKVMERQRDECATVLEVAATSFDKTFIDRRPSIEVDISSVKLELMKLNTFFNREAKDLGPSKAGVLTSGSAPEQSPFASTADGSNGHHVEQRYQDCGFGSHYRKTSFIHRVFKFVGTDKYIQIIFVSPETDEYKLIFIGFDQEETNEYKGVQA